MNIYKLFSGTFSSISTSVRVLSWGNASPASMRAIATDEFNSIIADFLSNDCGVDASYSQKGSSTAKWLWINGIPYLFFLTSNYPSFRGPYCTNNIGNLTTITISSSTTSTTYDFGLIFSGNPKGSFCLTFINYSKAYILSVYFIRGKNLITNSDVFVAAASASEYVFAWELNSDVDEPKDINHNCLSSISASSATQAAWFVNTLTADFTNHPQKILLRKVTAGIFEFDDVYSYCRNCPYLPSATLTGSAQSLPVIEIKGEKFVVIYTSVVSFLLKLVE